MAFAEASDVVKALRRALTSDETEYVDDVILEAQYLIIGYLGCDPTNEDNDPAVPAAVTLVTARMVARVFQQADQVVGADVQTAGPFSTTFTKGVNSGSPWFAGTDKIMLKPHRCGGGMRSVAFKSERGFPECDDES